ncbi:MAG: hypothetical protein WA939_18245, partial [Nodosilinea sp.]
MRFSAKWLGLVAATVAMVPVAQFSARMLAAETKPADESATVLLQEDGVLEDGDGVLEDGSLYDVYTIEGKRVFRFLCKPVTVQSLKRSGNRIAKCDSAALQFLMGRVHRLA